MHSHTAPNLPLYKGLNILLQVWERGKFTFCTKLKSCLTAPQLWAVPPLCCCCILPWLGSVAALAPLKVPEEVFLSLTTRFTHTPPCRYPPTGKSHGDLEAKCEYCRCHGCWETSAAKGPSSHTPLVKCHQQYMRRGLEKSLCSRLTQLGCEQRGVGAVGTGSGVTEESIEAAQLFSCNPETESCSKSHLSPRHHHPPHPASSPAKHSLS